MVTQPLEPSLGQGVEVVPVHLCAGANLAAALPGVDDLVRELRPVAARGRARSLHGHLTTGP